MGENIGISQWGILISKKTDNNNSTLYSYPKDVFLRKQETLAALSKVTEASSEQTNKKFVIPVDRRNTII